MNKNVFACKSLYEFNILQYARANSCTRRNHLSTRGKKLFRIHLHRTGFVVYLMRCWFDCIRSSKAAEFNLHDTGAAGQISVVVAFHHGVFRVGVVLSAISISFHLLLKRERVGQDAEALLKLPAANFTNGLGAADGLGKHESTNNSQELNQRDCQSACSDQHGALLNDVIQAWQAAVGIKIVARQLASRWIHCERRTARVRNDGLTAIGFKNIPPVIRLIDSATFQLETRRNKNVIV